MGSQIVDQKNRVIRIVVMFTLGVLPLAYFIFAFKTFKIQFHGVSLYAPPPFHYVLVCKIHNHIPEITFSSLLTEM